MASSTKTQQVVAGQVQIRWTNQIPPSRYGGGWQMSDDGLAWRQATQAEVDLATDTRLVYWVG
jgi:hypothetical protein